MMYDVTGALSLFPSPQPRTEAAHAPREQEGAQQRTKTPASSNRCVANQAPERRANAGKPRRDRSGGGSQAAAGSGSGCRWSGPRGSGARRHRPRTTSTKSGPAPRSRVGECGGLGRGGGMHRSITAAGGAHMVGMQQGGPPRGERALPPRARRPARTAAGGVSGSRSQGGSVSKEP